jgi:DNA recombination protein Rad52
MSFSEEQTNLLNEPLLKENVKTREGTGNTQLSYLASFHVIEEANRIFGFDGWDSEILSLTQADKTEYEKPPYNAGDDPKQMISISYLCKLRVTVKSGDTLTVREDVGFGNGVAGATAYGIGSCIELASKEAVTDALKRCMRYYGNKFGLTLYDKDANEVLNLDEFEASKTVTEDQLESLRALYADRGIDDEWVLLALKAENYTGDSLEGMRQDWFNLVFDIAYKYKLDELKAASYEEDIKKVIKLMSESANINMLKALFKEAWEKTKKHDDKDRQAECQKLYESMKEKLEK